MTEALSAERTRRLLSEGYVVVDGLLGEMRASTMQLEMAALVEQGLMKPHMFKFGDARFRKPHIYEADLHDAALRGLVPSFNSMYAGGDIAAVLNAHAPDLQLRRGAAATTVKLQYNDGGGGCFPSAPPPCFASNNRVLSATHRTDTGYLLLR
jgi:hypothetical protein